MAKEAVYRCAVCDKLKSVSNHWYLLQQHDGAYHQTPWNDRAADDARLLNLCGRACVHKAIEKWMEEAEAK